jgi:CRP/FNR family transcriptional regulator, anaerobic regulatory protein
MARNKCRTCAVRDVALCRTLPPDALAELNQIARRRKVPAGQRLFDQDQQPPLVANIVSGVARLSRSLDDGRTQIVALQFAPDFVGRPYAASGSVLIEAATDMELCCFARSHFNALLDSHGRLKELLIEHMSRSLEQAREWMLLLGRKTAEERVASLVFHCAERMRARDCAPEAGFEGMQFEMPLSRTEMADFLGLTLETVGRMMQRLARSGVIEIQRRRGIRIVDIARLRLAAAHNNPQ